VELSLANYNGATAFSTVFLSCLEIYSGKEELLDRSEDEMAAGGARCKAKEGDSGCLVDVAVAAGGGGELSLEGAGMEAVNERREEYCFSDKHYCGFYNALMLALIAILPQLSLSESAWLLSFGPAPSARTESREEEGDKEDSSSLPQATQGDGEQAERLAGSWRFSSRALAIRTDAQQAWEEELFLQSQSKPKVQHKSKKSAEEEGPSPYGGEQLRNWLCEQLDFER
jgi:hypothetical protein